MGFDGFFRTVFPYFLVIAIVSALVWFILGVVIKEIKEKETKNIIHKTRKYIVWGLILIFLVSVIISAIANLFPRSDIDRQAIDYQNKQWEQRQLQK